MQGKAERPTIGSAKWCAVTLRHEDQDGWFNTGHVLPPPDPHVWLSMTGARIVAEWAGWTSPADAQQLRERVAELEAQLETAISEIGEHRKFREQVDGLAAAGMEVVKTGGRPTRQTRPDVIRRELEETAA